jgi:hypothetical protein
VETLIISYMLPMQIKREGTLGVLIAVEASLSGIIY